MCAKLDALNPKCFSMPFGAGGSTQKGTLDTVLDILREGHEAGPHLSCRDSSRESLRQILMHTRVTVSSIWLLCTAICRTVTVRWIFHPGEFRYVNEPIEFIRSETGDWFYIKGVADPEMHPQATSPQDDVQRCFSKVKDGTNGAIIQYFYNADAYFHFVDEAQKLGVVLAGIMLITNYSQLMGFFDMCGTEIPCWIRLKLASYGDDTY